MVGTNTTNGGRPRRRVPQLLTALALLFTATHCVSIDDRDLEENSGACQRSTDDPLCTACTKESCCDEAVACAESDDCLDFISCIDPCADDVCFDLCIYDYPEGADIAEGLAYCINDSCSDVCADS